MTDIILIYVTAASADQAKAIGRDLVQNRLVACANVIDGMGSIYAWQGRIEEQNEAVLIVKTVADRFQDVAARIRALHSYDTPCIIALPITQGDAPFLAWVAQAVSPRTE